MEATTVTRSRPRSSCAATATPREAGLGWLSTTDHKRIGIMYFAAALVFFVVGGAEALLMQLQLAQAEHADRRPDLQRPRDDARDHDGLPVRDPDPGGVRELLGSAHDRLR